MTEKQTTLTGIENRWEFIHPDGDYPKIIAPNGCFYCFAFAFDARLLCKELNELTEEIKQLKEQNKDLEQTIDTICDDYEESHGMDIRNSDWFTAW